MYVKDKERKYWYPIIFVYIIFVPAAYNNINILMINSNLK